MATTRRGPAAEGADGRARLVGDPRPVRAVPRGVGVGAATTPGNENFKAKWADWFRSHHAAFVVNPLEQWYYNSHAPAKGGAPKALNRIPAASAHPAGISAATAGLPAPTPVPLLVSPALPGEGQWQPTGPIIDGRAAMYVAEFRADTIYTSQITSAMWIDPARLRIRLIPGSHEPGGTWSVSPDLTGTAAAQAVAAFNGGFRFQDARGGFYLGGRTAVPLVNGAASVVIYKDGRVNVLAWGTHLDPADPTSITGAKLYPQMQRSADRYLGPTEESRDFFSVSTS